MAKFIILKKEDRLKLFKIVKKNTQLSFNKLPLLLNISRTSFFNYYSRNCPIPIEVFEKLEKIARLRITNYQLIEKERFLRKSIVLPKLNEFLAELIGALNGDGHISKYKYEVNIVSHSDEEDYQEYLKDLFEKIFGVTTSSLYLRDTTIKMRVYSKDIHNFLIEKYGLPIGEKKGNLKIPRAIKKSSFLLKSYLRGLFDTDGTIYKRREKEMVLSISSADKRFLKEIFEVLRNFGFSVSLGKKDVILYTQKDIRKFFNEIKPANTKHLKKFEIYSNL